MSETDDWLASLLKQPGADVADLEPVTTAEAARRLVLLGVPDTDHAGVLATLLSEVRPRAPRKPRRRNAERLRNQRAAAPPAPARPVSSLPHPPATAAAVEETIW
jgi:hypothetical protein